MGRGVAVRVATGLLVAALAPVGCGDDDPPPSGYGENAGQACAVVDDCYPDLTEPLQGGDAECLTRVPDGYCTHHCGSDADCCAADGECDTPHPQVCAPFESTGWMLCFLSCEQADVDAAGLSDDNEYCARFAHPSFGCRSTGGGSQNRKVCVP